MSAQFGKKTVIRKPINEIGVDQYIASMNEGRKLCGTLARSVFDYDGDTSLNTVAFASDDIRGEFDDPIWDSVRAAR